MASQTEAIVFVPGLEWIGRTEARERLVRGLVEVTERARVERIGDSALPGEKGVRLRVRDADGERDLDIFEAYWGDLADDLRKEPPLRKIVKGFSVLRYWVVSRTWLALRGSRYMALSLFLSTFLLMAWYYGVLAVGLTAIGSDPEWMSGAGASATVTDGSVAHGSPDGLALTGPGLWEALGRVRSAADAVDFLGQLGRAMQGWQVWLSVSLLMGVLPVTSLVAVASFTKRYLRNEIHDGGSGQRDRIRNRVKETLNAVLGQNDYNRITVVSHSFGTVITTDILADLSLETIGRSVRYVTLGSPVGFLCLRSRWLESELEKCHSNPVIDHWIDFHSDEDWMCGRTPGLSADSNRYSHRIRPQASAADKWLGRTHQSYFSNQTVMETLVSND